MSEEKLSSGAILHGALCCVSFPLSRIQSTRFAMLSVQSSSALTLTPFSRIFRCSQSNCAPAMADHPFFSLAEAPPWTSALLLIPRLAPPFTQQAAIQHAHRRRQQQQEPSRGIFLPYSSWVMSPFRRTMLASSVLFCSYWIVLASSGSGTGNAWCT